MDHSVTVNEVRAFYGQPSTGENGESLVKQNDLLCPIDPIHGVPGSGSIFIPLEQMKDLRSLSFAVS